jgi:hypothetical protein
MLIIKSAIVSMFSYFVIFSLLVIFQCIPVQSFWKQFSPQYHEDFYCLPSSNAPVANAIFGIVTDFVAALLPITLFTQIRIPTARKISLGLLFGVGFMYVPHTGAYISRLTVDYMHRLCILGIVKSIFLHRLFFETYDANCKYTSTFSMMHSDSLYLSLSIGQQPPTYPHHIV